MVYTEIFDEKYFIEIGRNVAENDDLIQKRKRYNIEDDLWFHLKGGPSPHGILSLINKTEKSIPLSSYSRDSIYRTASLIKSFSKAKNLKNVGVEYLPIKFIKLTDKPGTVEYLKNPKRIVV